MSLHVFVLWHLGFAPVVWFDLSKLLPPNI